MSKNETGSPELPPAALNDSTACVTSAASPCPGGGGGRGETHAFASCPMTEQYVFQLRVCLTELGADVDDTAFSIHGFHESHARSIPAI